MKCLRVGFILSAFLVPILCSAGSALAQANACMMATPEQVVICGSTNITRYEGTPALDVDMGKEDDEEMLDKEIKRQRACAEIVMANYKPAAGFPEPACPKCPNLTEGCGLSTSAPTIKDELGHARCRSHTTSDGTNVIYVTFYCQDCVYNYTNAAGNVVSMPCNYGTKLNNPLYAGILGFDKRREPSENIQLDLTPSEAKTILNNMPPTTREQSELSDAPAPVGPNGAMPPAVRPPAAGPR